MATALTMPTASESKRNYSCVWGWGQGGGGRGRPMAASSSISASHSHQGPKCRMAWPLWVEGQAPRGMPPNPFDPELECKRTVSHIPLPASAATLCWRTLRDCMLIYLQLQKSQCKK